MLSSEKLRLLDPINVEAICRPGVYDGRPKAMMHQDGCHATTLCLAGSARSLPGSQYRLIVAPEGCMLAVGWLAASIKT